MREISFSGAWVQALLARFSFSGKRRADFYATLESFVNDGVPLLTAVRDMHELYSAQKSPLAIITSRIIDAARGIDGAVVGMPQAIAWCAPADEVLALDAGEQAGDVALGLKTARECALRSGALVRTIISKLIGPTLFACALIGLLIFIRVELIPTMESLLPRLRWPHAASLLGRITDFVPTGVPLCLGVLAAYFIFFKIAASRWEPGPIRSMLDKYLFPWTIYAAVNKAVVLSSVAALVGAKISFGTAIERVRDNSKPWLASQLDSMILDLRKGVDEGTALAALYDGDEKWLITAYGKRSNFSEKLHSLSDQISKRLINRISWQFALVSFVLLFFGTCVLGLLPVSLTEMAQAVKKS